MSPASNTSSKSKRIVSRARMRGAAMVEAAVILPVIIVFFGVMATAHAAAKAKLTAQQDARASLMYYATNDCSKRMATDESSSASDTGAALPAGDEARGSSLADRAAGGSIETRSTWMFAEGSAKASATTYGRSRAAQSQSWAVCNERKTEGDIKGLTGAAFDSLGSKLPAPIRSSVR